MATPTNPIDQLIAQAGSVEKAIELVRKRNLAAIRGHFTDILDGAVEFRVLNWAAIEAFDFKPKNGDKSPAVIFDELLAATTEAIQNHNEAEVIKNLFLVYKAVKRGAN
jgi:hypothetical protein